MNTYPMCIGIGYVSRYLWILYEYVSKTCVGIEYVSRYLIRYGLKYLCFIGSKSLIHVA
jgi:hypothetical protein